MGFGKRGKKVTGNPPGRKKPQGRGGENTRSRGRSELGLKDFSRTFTPVSKRSEIQRWELLPLF